MHLIVLSGLIDTGIRELAYWVYHPFTYQVAGHEGMRYSW